MRGDVRLENGANKFEGRVEVCGRRNDSNMILIWKTVCNAGWDVNEARVVCRQLGFSGNQNRMLIHHNYYHGQLTHSAFFSYSYSRWKLQWP